MATPSDARAVKSLNKSSGRRFVFKTFSQRIEEIDIDVYRTLDPLKAEPSEGSSFFRDTLVEYRELNTAEDFTSIYEEVFPLVQTLPQIILQKDFIISNLLSILKLEGRLSHEPILRIASFPVSTSSGQLKRINFALLTLLITGIFFFNHNGSMEILEQFKVRGRFIVYMSLLQCPQLCINMKLTRKYAILCHCALNGSEERRLIAALARDLLGDFIPFLQRIADSLESLLQSGADRDPDIIEQIFTSWSYIMMYLQKYLTEDVGHVLRLHSKTETLLPLLVDDLFFQVGDESVEGSRAVLEVLILAFERLYAELDLMELTFVWKCLCKKITDSVTSGNSVHLGRLLALLISVVQNDYLGKISDYEAMVELVGLLVQTFVIPQLTMKIVDTHPEVIDKVLQLMLCVIGGLSSSKNMPALLRVSSQWEPVFNLRSRSAFNNLIEISDEEVVYLMINFCEKLEGEGSSFLYLKSKETLSRIQDFFEETLHCWIGKISEVVQGNLFPFHFNKMSWQSYGVFLGAILILQMPSKSILTDGLDKCNRRAFDGGIQFPESTWHSLTGAALRAYRKLVFSRNIVREESAMTKFLDLAKRYKLSPKILSAVADILDSISMSSNPPDRKCQYYLPEYIAGMALDALDIFAENLCHANKEIRLSTLRILCHYEPIYYERSRKELPIEDNNVSETSHVDDPNNVLSLLRSIEETALSISTSRKVILLISKIQMSLSAQRVASEYMPVVLNGIIGVFHNRFSYLWNPALECLTILIGQYFRLVWSKYIKYLDHCQSVFLASTHQYGGGGNDSNKDSGLVGCFNSDIFTSFDGTPRATVLSLLIQTLQRVPSIMESHSRQIVPLFLKFLGYNVDEIICVESHTLNHKGKEWKRVLKEWLSLFRLLRNPKAFHQSQFFRDVLLYRLLDQNDADVQMIVLDCLLNWRDDFLLPYSENMRNLINAKCLREELTRWNLSRTSIDSIDVRHRAYVVPIVIRILIPKVRNLKTLACQKNASVHHRRAVLGFLAQLDVDELPIFFWLLLKPLLSVSQSDNETSKIFWSLPQSHKDEIDTSEILKHFTTDTINTLSWKKRYGFLHVVEDILTVFDESHLNPFLNLLMQFVVRILASCTSSLGSRESSGSSSIHNCSSFDLDVAGHDEVGDKITERMAVKQFKDVRSLCLKIIYRVLSKYEDHVNLGGRSLIPDIFSILTVPSASESILSCVLKFTKNLLKLDSELGSEDIRVKRILLPHLDVLICSLHSIFTNGVAAKSVHFVLIGFLGQIPGKREFTIFNLLSKYIQEASAAKTFIDLLLPLLTKRHLNFADLAVRNSICDVLDAVSANDSSVLILAKIIRELNAASEVEMGALDYDKVLCAYDKVNVKFFCTVPEEHALPLLAHSVHDMSSEEMILRQSALRLLLSFIEFSGEILNGSLKSDHIWSEASIQRIVNNFFLKHMGNAMDKEGAVKKCLYSLSASVSTPIRETLGISSGMRSEACFSPCYDQTCLHTKNFGHEFDETHSRKLIAIIPMHALRILLVHGLFWGFEGGMGAGYLVLPSVANLDSYRALCCEDAEQDFFSNIVHLQKHRRARAVSRFAIIVSSGNMSEVITNKVIVPLLFSMLLDAQDGKDEHIRSACLDALASISGCMKWDRYYALLLRCFRDLTLKPEKQKLLLRLICSILDHFHFSEPSLVYEAKVSGCDPPDPYTIDITFSSALRKCTSSVGLPDTQTCLHKKLFPKIQKLLTSNSDNVNVKISLVALKLLKLLPGEIMDSQLLT
ncbi:hypothetical protein DH2020_048670 [Rehmannia glutinosa]|uniref:U3 small nucleolar RNA-associated protein 20 N-terminal domain-containing protein n=1 Tax=Rehmannia glutinosa TaxID=99300 RepID=A0ABR0U526_REHGL